MRVVGEIAAPALCSTKGDGRVPAQGRVDKDLFSFDHLVGDSKHVGRNSQAEGPGSLKINHQLEFGWLHDW
jgi:hypothetical protein